MEEINSKVEMLWALALKYGPKVIGVIAVLVGAWIVAGLVRSATHKTLTRANFDATLTKFFANSSRYVVLALAFVGCLGVFGIQTTSFAAMIGAAGLAVGLAFQGTLGNIAAGIMLLVFRPFKVGDFIIVAGESGVVQVISLFTTDLTKLDNRRIIIPNGKVFGDTITNVTYEPKRRVDILVGVEYSADIDETRKVLEECIANIEGVIEEPAPQIFLSGLGASSVDWQVRVWCETPDYWNVYQSGIRAVKYALDKAEISIPFPQMDIHFDREYVAARTSSLKSASA